MANRLLSAQTLFPVMRLELVLLWSNVDRKDLKTDRTESRAPLCFEVVIPSAGVFSQGAWRQNALSSFLQMQV